MADLTKRIIFIILYWISEIRLISAAHYCEWGLCSVDEECCGSNECCSKSTISNQVLYITSLSLVALMFGALCWCGLNEYRRQRRNKLRALLRETNKNIEQMTE